MIWEQSHCSVSTENADQVRSLFKSLRRVWHVWACRGQPDDIVVIQTIAVYETMRSLAAEAMLPQCRPTLPSGLADARLALAATSVRAATVGQAVRDVAGFPLPAGLTVAVHRTRAVPHATLAAAGAVVGTCIHPEREERGGNREEE